MDRSSGDRFLVEVDGKGVGVLIEVRSGFQFFASAPEAFPEDQKIFPTGAAARAAIMKHYKDPKLVA